MSTTERCERIVQVIDEALRDYELNVSVRLNGISVPAFARPTAAQARANHVDR